MTGVGSTEYGDYGGRYVPETLMAALAQLESAYLALCHDPVFWADLRELLTRFAGRPTSLYRADRLAAAVGIWALRRLYGADCPTDVRDDFLGEDVGYCLSCDAGRLVKSMLEIRSGAL